MHCLESLRGRGGSMPAHMEWEKVFDHPKPARTSVLGTLGHGDPMGQAHLDEVNRTPEKGN
jgi:hypothetical protein